MFLNTSCVQDTQVACCTWARASTFSSCKKPLPKTLAYSGVNGNKLVNNNADGDLTSFDLDAGTDDVGYAEISDCGFSTAAGAMNVPTEIVYAKLQSMVKGAQLASEMAKAEGPFTEESKKGCEK